MPKDFADSRRYPACAAYRLISELYSFTREPELYEYVFAFTSDLAAVNETVFGA
jgi:hypothetical protein